MHWPIQQTADGVGTSELHTDDGPRRSQCGRNGPKSLHVNPATLRFAHKAPRPPTAATVSEAVSSEEKGGRREEGKPGAKTDESPQTTRSAQPGNGIGHTLRTRSRSRLDSCSQAAQLPLLTARARTGRPSHARAHTYERTRDDAHAVFATRLRQQQQHRAVSSFV